MESPHGPLAVVTGVSRGIGRLGAHKVQAHVASHLRNSVVAAGQAS